jgi:hypothetical protein
MQPESIKDVLILLYQVQYSLTQTQFRELFADAATHLWSKFSTVFDYNLVEFYANLDPEKKSTMCNYLSTYNPRAL